MYRSKSKRIWKTPSSGQDYSCKSRKSQSKFKIITENVRNIETEFSFPPPSPATEAEYGPFNDPFKDLCTSFSVQAETSTSLGIEL